MSSPRFTVTPAKFDTPKPTSFTVTNSTVAKVVIEPQVKAPGVAATPTPDFYGGGTLLDLVAASTDAAPKDIIMWLGTILSTVGAASGAVTLTAQNKLSRVAGSWITDKWLVGDLVMTFAPVGSAQVAAGIDGIVGVVTAVVALDLTVNGTPWVAGAQVLTTGTRVVNVSQLFRATIAANAGNTAAIPNASLLANPMDSAVIKSELKLGEGSMLIASMQAAVAALPAYISLSPRIALY